MKDIEYAAKKLSGDSSSMKRSSLYLTDSNFGLMPEDIKVAEGIQELKLKYNWPSYIMATTAKNRKENVIKISNLLSGAMRITGAVQSLDNEVLENVKRGQIDQSILCDLALLSKESGADSYSDVILGLPGDSLAAHESTIKQLVNAKFDRLTLYQLRLHNDSDMVKKEYQEKFKISKKWRPLNRCYGDYAFNKERIIVAEVEEVCVEGCKMSFEDYLNARVLDLIVAIFYFDKMFDGFLRCIDYFEIDRYEWLIRIRAIISKTNTLTDVIEAFKAETIGELWETEKELLECCETAEAIDKYINGELGANLLGKYRLRALSDSMKEIVTIAKEGAFSVLEDSKKYQGERLVLKKFVNDLATYEYERKRNILDLDVKEDSLEFNFDINGFLFGQKTIEDVLTRPGLYRLSFYRTNEQEANLVEYKKMFGDTVMGRYMNLVRIRVSSLYRHTRSIY